MKEVLITAIIVALFRFLEGRLNKLVEKSKTTANTWDDWLYGILYAIVSAVSGVVTLKKLRKKSR